MVNLYYEMYPYNMGNYYQRIWDDMDLWIDVLEKNWPPLVEARLEGVKRKDARLVDPQIIHKGSKRIYDVDAYKAHVTKVLAMLNGNPQDVLAELKPARQSAQNNPAEYFGLK